MIGESDQSGSLPEHYHNSISPVVFKSTNRETCQPQLIMYQPHEGSSGYLIGSLRFPKRLPLYYSNLRSFVSQTT